MYIVKVKGSLSCLVDEKWHRLLGDASQACHDEWQAVELCSLQSRCNATLVLVVGLQGGVAAPDAALKNHFSTLEYYCSQFPRFLLSRYYAHFLGQCIFHPLFRPCYNDRLRKAKHSFNTVAGGSGFESRFMYFKR